MATTTRSRSTGTTKRAPRKRTTNGAASPQATRPRTASLADEAKTAARALRTRTSRAARTLRGDTGSLSIAAGVIAGVMVAGVAIFLGRDRLRNAASTGAGRLRKAANDISTMAHDRIDQARDNITRFRARHGDADSGTAMPARDSMAIAR